MSDNSRAMLVGAALLAVSTLLVLTSMSAAQVQTPSPGPTKEMIQNPAQQQTIGASTKTASGSGKGTPTSDWMPSWVTANGVVPVFTVVLAVVAVFQLLTYLAIHRSNKVVERAYVNISHYSYPGGALQFDGPQRKPKVKVKIKNHGTTPATIKNVVLTLRISRDPLPKKPTYDELGVEEKKEFFLVTKDHFDVTKTFSEEEARRVEDTTATVWLLGYVDYQDKFGRSHRGGYARRYDRSPYLAAGNNLVFESKPGYNYDTK